MFSSLNQKIGAALGGVYVLLGGVGFAITGFDGFVSTNTGDTLLFLELNGLHNMVHILIGVVLLMAARNGERISSALNMAVGSVYLAVGIVGLFSIDTDVNILSLNHPDNVLHLGTALVLLAVGLARLPATKDAADVDAEPVSRAPREAQSSRRQKRARPAADDAPTQALTLQGGDDYDAMSKESLYARAQKLDIAGRSTMSKEELAEAVRTSTLATR